MFKHLLLPTDGSTLSEQAAFQGVEFARQIGARVTALHVQPLFHVLTYRSESLEDTRDAYARDTQLHARKYLDVIVRMAAEARVACDVLSEVSDHPHEVIVQTADKLGCDLILMASHGRRGMAGLLLGSETQRVLTHAKVPVMVWR
jgi:nucleotide-binding universal stress UspA family protein